MPSLPHHAFADPNFIAAWNTLVDTVNATSSSDLLANRPAAATYGAGFFYALDVGRLFYSNGTNWYPTGTDVASTDNVLGVTFTQNAWTDVPGMTMNLPAGLPLTIIGKAMVNITTTATVTAGQTYAQLRIVDEATGSTFFAGVEWQQQLAAAATQAYTNTLYAEEDIEPLTAATTVKMQMICPTYANVTTATNPNFGTYAIIMRARAR